jgi:hypothetical protein
MDLGLGAVVHLPDAETKRRWEATTPQWPIMHATLSGVSRDQMMGRHKSNHIQVVYSNNGTAAVSTLHAKAAMAHHLGMEVHCCGDVTTPPRSNT